VFNYLRAGFKHRETRQNGVASVKIYSAILLLPIVKCKMISTKIEMQNRSNFLSGALPRASLGGQSSRLYVTATTGVRAPDLSCELEPARALSGLSLASRLTNLLRRRGWDVKVDFAAVGIVVR
jgi:hypothetical protein